MTFLSEVSLWRRTDPRNVRLYYQYWQYSNLFIFRFVSLLCLRNTLRLWLICFFYTLKSTKGPQDFMLFEIHSALSQRCPPLLYHVQLSKCNIFTCPRFHPLMPPQTLFSILLNERKRPRNLMLSNIQTACTMYIYTCSHAHANYLLTRVRSKVVPVVFIFVIKGAT